MEYQDRNRWNMPIVCLAHQILLDSEDASFSLYHLEASIACMHCTAKKFEDTNWGAICRYYETLLKIYPSPFAEINYAVSQQYNRQPDKAYAILKALNENPYFSRFHLLNISLGKYFDRMGDKKNAQIFFAKAEKIRSDI